MYFLSFTREWAFWIRRSYIKTWSMMQRYSSDVLMQLERKKKKRTCRGKRASSAATEDGFSQLSCFTVGIFYSKRERRDRFFQGIESKHSCQDHVVHFKGFYLIWNVWKTRFAQFIHYSYSFTYAVKCSPGFSVLMKNRWKQHCDGGGSLLGMLAMMCSSSTSSLCGSDILERLLYQCQLISTCE